MKDNYSPELNDLATIIHERSRRAGFYDGNQRDFDGMMMNVVTEAAEAQEQWRLGRKVTETHWKIVGEPVDEGKLDGLFRTDREGNLWVKNYDYDVLADRSTPEWLQMTPELLRRMPNLVRHLKPEGIPSELADIIIRVLDICAYHDIDIAASLADKMAFNATRSYRHGGKLS